MIAVLGRCIIAPLVIGEEAEAGLPADKDVVKEMIVEIGKEIGRQIKELREIMREMIQLEIAAALPYDVHAMAEHLIGLKLDEQHTALTVAPAASPRPATQAAFQRSR